MSARLFLKRLSWQAGKSGFIPVLVALASLALAGARVRAADEVQYNRDIRPILSENCFACHGPDSASRKAGLRLDQREVAIKKEAFVPGKPDESELIQRINSNEKREMMPPPVTKKRLTAAQKHLLKRWIAAGAKYEPHWSLIPPKRPALPVVKDSAWCRNPIDRFTLAAMEKHGLRPAPEADRRTLARRLSLDLIGLPPGPDEVETFVNDRRPDAYEHFVDHLFKSPHYGEHRARYWLDAARYADSNGIHFDNYREMFSYRDWVIDAFNRNKPFDQFTVEQLAGDLLPNRTLDQQIATGFSRCNITTNEGGAINEEYLVLYTRDRTETAAQVWLGMTAGCAVCHDHKYDPLTIREFYSMSAFFNNTTQNAMDGNVADTPPVVFVPGRDDRPRWEVLAKELAEFKAQEEVRKKAARPSFERWAAEATTAQINNLVPGDDLQLHAPLDEGMGNTVNISVDGKSRPVTLDSITWTKGKIGARAFTVRTGKAIEVPEVGNFEKDQAFSVGAWVRIADAVQTGAVLARMDNTKNYRGWDLWVENRRVGMHIINNWPDNALRVTTKMLVPAGQWVHVFATYDGSGRAAGVKLYVNGALQPVEVNTDKLTQTIRAPVPLKIGQRHMNQGLKNLGVQDVRLYGHALSGPEVEQITRSTPLVSVVAKTADKRTPAETGQLFDWWLAYQDEGSRALRGRLTTLQQEEAAIKARGTVAHVMQERPKEAMAYVLFRGDYDKRRDPVKAGTPAALPPMSPDLPHNRLGFARWLLRPENPLTARVTVNRFWQEIFGTAIVRTAGDFGVAGELPSHPELLDWLAVEFRDSGWDMQRVFRLLVTSATYRQSAAVSPQALEKDPQNRLLSHAPRYRMDAEMIRDYALAASGLLVRKIGGPSVKPYQPEGVWEAVGMIGSNTREYKQDHGDRLYRRSMYTLWKRAAPPASMDILNAPNRETCAVRRERTDTPLQALVTLNDPQFVEAARNLAQLALKRGGTKTESRLDLMARRLIARPLRAEEVRIVQTGLKDLLTHYRSHGEDARKLITVGESRADPSLDVPTLAAWTMLANEMLNLDEVLNK
jgi:Protein of unknown function (DUF1553)/Protein of unknown function (DUF1549)/Concanavalin A-like lectin/glucanases superfamily/Planctomycete cytochrome C